MAICKPNVDICRVFLVLDISSSVNVLMVELSIPCQYLS